MKLQARRFLAHVHSLETRGQLKIGMDSQRGDMGKDIEVDQGKQPLLRTNMLAWESMSEAEIPYSDSNKPLLFR